MRFSDIKEGYIYNVIFDPVRNCEFNGKHLAVVFKKNHDKETAIVMPPYKLEPLMQIDLLH